MSAGEYSLNPCKYFFKFSPIILIVRSGCFQFFKVATKKKQGW